MLVTLNLLVHLPSHLGWHVLVVIDIEHGFHEPSGPDFFPPNTPGRPREDASCEKAGNCVRPLRHQHVSHGPNLWSLDSNNHCFNGFYMLLQKNYCFSKNFRLQKQVNIGQPLF